MFNKFIHRPVLSIVISLIVTLLGVIALMQLPVTQFPSISPPALKRELGVAVLRGVAQAAFFPQGIDGPTLEGPGVARGNPKLRPDLGEAEAKGPEDDHLHLFPGQLEQMTQRQAMFFPARRIF